MASRLLGRPPVRGPPKLRVVVVSDNSETLDGLERYLESAGIAVLATRAIERTRALAASMPPSAVVLFPDDFPRAAVRTTLAQLGRAEPAIATVVITSDLRQFPPASEGLVVLPKPAWGWTILDALRTLQPEE